MVLILKTCLLFVSVLNLRYLQCMQHNQGRNSLSIGCNSIRLDGPSDPKLLDKTLPGVQGMSVVWGSPAIVEVIWGDRGVGSKMPSPYFHIHGDH